MTKRVQEKARHIEMPRTGEPAAGAGGDPGEGDSVAAAPVAAEPGGRPLPPELAPRGRAFTGVGEMMSSLGRSSPLGQELEAAKAKLRQFEGAALVRRVDPRRVVRSRWANRDEAEFATEDFAAFKAEIESAGGNVQAIGVRPARGVFDGQTPPREGVAGQAAGARAADTYEIVFGHRRHRACLELGLPVRVVVEDIDDRELFQVMDRENRQRKNLSAWEQGSMYRKALDEGLFPSLRRLAEVLGVNLSAASQSVSIARLPPDVVQAFRTPLDIQFRWASALAEAMRKDPEGVLERARAMTATPPAERNARAVLAALLATGPASAAGAGPVVIENDGRVVALLRPKRNGGLDIDIRQPVDTLKAAAMVRKLLGL